MADPTSCYRRKAKHHRQPASSVSPRRAAERTAFAVLVLATTISAAGAPLAAQGTTGAAISGRVLSADSTPVEQAIVHAVNRSNGARWKTTTNTRGRYSLEYLSIGGPYRIEIRAVGYEPAQRDSIVLALGQRLTVDIALTSAVLQLEPITVTGTAAGLSSARTGPAQTISKATIERLPVPGRDYTELARLSPQVTRSRNNGGLSFTGQHDRYNSIQIDGVDNTDPFGRAASGNGTPGWAVRLTSFTPEAVKELQIITAPFDVRFGNFAGGLVNAVTESGSNAFEGSIVGYLESSDLVGTDSTGFRGDEFNRKELGLTLGVPIVRDRVALFLNAAVSREVVPQPVPEPTSDTTGGADSAGVGIRYESLVRFQDLIRGYRVDPGTFTAGSYRTPNRNLFVKVTAQLGVNSRLEVSHDYGHGNDLREIGERFLGFYAFSSSGKSNPETINATAVNWTAAFGTRFANELSIARKRDRRTCFPNSTFAAVSVIVDEGEITAGIPDLCLGLEAGHTLWGLTDNLSVVAGNHRLTFGTQARILDLVDDALIFPAGRWTFDGLDALEQGTPTAYVRDALAPGGSQAAFKVRKLDFYVQDQWLPTPRLTLTAGLRVDVPFIPTEPVRDPVAQAELGINTALTPSGNALWSPRLGVNYDLSGRGATVLRGGVGLFAGAPAYYWFRNVYSTTGARALRFECEGENVPAFTLDPKNPPTECTGSAPATRIINYFDPEFRFPRNLKLAVGADLILPQGIVGSVDLLYTRTVDGFHLVDVNLTGPVGVAAGEGGRTIYGDSDPETGLATPSRRTSLLRGVYEIRNGSGGRSYSLAAQLAKRFPIGVEVSAAYTYTDATDRLSSDADFSIQNASSTPVDGTLEQRQIRTSFWERPHKVTLVATADLPLGFAFGLTYVGMSGAPFTYVSVGDPNADGFGGNFGVPNDVVYVPRDSNDVTLADPTEFAALDSLIRDEPCLRAQRGRLLRRNTCREAWVHETNARLSKRFRLADKRILEVSADVFNLLNFLDGDWGVVRSTLPMDFGNTVPLLDMVGYDTPNERGVYQLLPIYRRSIDWGASRWRIQLGSTLSF